MRARVLRTLTLMGAVGVVVIVTLQGSVTSAQSCGIAAVFVPQCPLEGCPLNGNIYYYACGADVPFDSDCVGPQEEVPGCCWCNNTPPDGPDLESCDCESEGDDQEPMSCSLVGDPVHAGSGVFLTEPAVDVRYAGSEVPLELVRYYASREPWLPLMAGPQFETERTRLAMGWTHTFDERLLAASAHGVVEEVVEDEEEDLVLVHRLPTGRGRRFVCPAPHDPASTFECTTT